MNALIVLAVCAVLIGLWWFRQICADYVAAGRAAAELRRRDTEQAHFDDQFAQIIAQLERRP
ncbi:hypothetical protein [Kitasatospora cathayae]|uniref:Uncharacterized protein n=1 Tax=Kitasatospora cathayae TaxID=3004092 RepID=A0ABY7Q9U1_9ACTN|nr:hypothetical protein [Kitasatospora sp. HUAS 3-15]WBP89505.1 hypothetical protein O1G21_29140 [Kitasatospora sp. HUAS 3-15]